MPKLIYWWEDFGEYCGHSHRLPQRAVACGRRWVRHLAKARRFPMEELRDALDDVPAAVRQRSI